MRKWIIAVSLILLISGTLAMAQEGPMGALRIIHQRIAKSETDRYITALGDTIRNSMALPDTAARQLFLSDLNAALGITELEGEDNAEALKRIKDTLSGSDEFTAASRKAVWDYARANLVAE